MSPVHRRASISYRHVPAPSSHTLKTPSCSLVRLRADCTSQYDGYENARYCSPSWRLDESLHGQSRKYYDEDIQQEVSLDEWERQEELAAEQRNKGWKWPENDEQKTYFIISINGSQAGHNSDFATKNNVFTSINDNDDWWGYVGAGDWGDERGDAQDCAAGWVGDIFDDDSYANIEYAHIQHLPRSNTPSPQLRTHSRMPSYTYSEVHEPSGFAKGLGLNLIEDREYNTRRCKQ